MKCTATYQSLSGVLRVHPFGVTGTPWTWACTCVVVGDEATLYGVLEAPTPSQWRALAQCLRGMGVTRARYERRNTPHDRTVTVDLTDADGRIVLTGGVDVR